MRAKRNAGVDPGAEREAAKAQRQAAKIQGVTLADIWAAPGKGAPPKGMSRRSWTIQLVKSWRKGGDRHGTPIDCYLDTIAAAQTQLQRPATVYRPLGERHRTNDRSHPYRRADHERHRPRSRAALTQSHKRRNAALADLGHDRVCPHRKGRAHHRQPAYLEKSSRIDGRRRQIGRDALSRLLGHKDPHVKEHFPALPVEDVPRFMARLRATSQAWNWLRLHPGQPDRRMLAAELIILQVGGRETAVSTARYSQVHNYPRNDIREGQFVRGLEIRHKPGKGGITVVPLSERAWEIITTCAAEDGIDLTAPPTKRDVPIFFKSGIAATEFGGGKHWDKYLKRIAEGAHPPFPNFGIHGTARSCFSDWAYAQLQAQGRDDPVGIIEQCQLHSTKTKVRAAYKRDEYYEDRRRQLEAWSQYCTSGKLAPDKIVNMDKHHTKTVNDTELLKELREIMTTRKAPNLWAATALVADRAGGKGTTLNGKQQRLRIKYRETYGYDDKDQREPCLEDEKPLLDEMHALLINREVRSLWEATDKVADRAKGSGKRVNTRDRLV